MIPHTTTYQCVTDHRDSTHEPDARARAHADARAADPRAAPPAQPCVPTGAAPPPRPLAGAHAKLPDARQPTIDRSRRTSNACAGAGAQARGGGAHAADAAGRAELELRAARREVGGQARRMGSWGGVRGLREAAGLQPAQAEKATVNSSLLTQSLMLAYGSQLCSSQLAHCTRKRFFLRSADSFARCRMASTVHSCGAAALGFFLDAMDAQKHLQPVSPPARRPAQAESRLRCCGHRLRMSAELTVLTSP